MLGLSLSNRILLGSLTAVLLLLFAPLQAVQANEPTPDIPPANTQPPSASPLATAILAGGCFWCIEADFEKLKGVIKAVSGYSGGWLENPTYKDVTSKQTGHLEVIEVTYDPTLLSYRAVIDYFLRHVDPTDGGGQFCDRGPSYATAIFVATPEERTIAAAAIADAQAELRIRFGEETTIVTPVREAVPFWKAETYHQDYYKKNPRRYAYYRWSCGRDKRVKSLWGTSEKTPA